MFIPFVVLSNLLPVTDCYSGIWTHARGATGPRGPASQSLGGCKILSFSPLSSFNKVRSQMKAECLTILHTISYSNVQKRTWFEIKNLHFLFDYLQKLKWSNSFWEFPDWIEWTVCVVVGSWLSLASKKMNQGIKRHKGEAEKKREISESTVGWWWRMLQTD